MAKPFADGVGDDVREAYEDVRSDGSETTWLVFHYSLALATSFGFVSYKYFLPQDGLRI